MLSVYDRNSMSFQEKPLHYFAVEQKYRGPKVMLSKKDF
jgi:hypothetical protein